MRKNVNNISVKIPSLIRTAEFTPTAIMLETLCCYVQSIEEQKVMHPSAILKKNGHSWNNWYKWKQKKHFIEWWTSAIENFYENEGLCRVHKSLFDASLGNSPQDRKTYLERFDRKYKPQQRLEHAAVGIEPPADNEPGVAANRSDERRKLIDSEEISAKTA